MAYLDVRLGKSSIAVLLCFVSCFPLAAHSYRLRVGDGASEITLESGVTSSVDFYLDNYQSLSRSKRIIVRHQPGGSGPFDKICQIEHSQAACHVAIGPCYCVGRNSTTYQYRLTMVFNPAYAGQWLFDLIDQQSTSINIVVTRGRTSSPTIKAPTSAPRHPPTTRRPAGPPSTLLSTTTVFTTITTAGVTPAYPEETQAHVYTPHPHEGDYTNDNGESNKHSQENDPSGEEEKTSGEEEKGSGEEEKTSGEEVVIPNFVTIIVLVVAFWKLGLLWD